MHLGEASDQVQPEPEPALRAVQRVADLGEQVEDAGQHFGRDAHAVVADPQDHLGPLDGDAQTDLAAVLGILGRVVQQVGKHLGHPIGIGIDEDGSGGQGDR